MPLIHVGKSETMGLCIMSIRIVAHSKFGHALCRNDVTATAVLPLSDPCTTALWMCFASVTRSTAQTDTVRARLFMIVCLDTGQPKITAEC